MIAQAGLYIHIPFCIRKCLYCDFYSVSDLSLTALFADALKQEMRMRADSEFTCDTIYIGGGTPSVTDPEIIADILQTAYQCFDISSDSEITIEVNPGTVSLEKLKAYRKAGINRLNIGVQSFHDEFLQFLGRIHSAEEAEIVIKYAKDAGFENIGLDLIYGIPGQSEKEWFADLNKAIGFDPEHLSCYMLTYEKETPLTRQLEDGVFYPADEEAVGNLFMQTVRHLTSCGYIHYEISNFARSESLTSRHNRKYWNHVPYFGFGPSAHSFIEPRRFQNVRSVSRYIQAGGFPIESEEILSNEQMIIEAIYLGLRQHKGINTELFEQRFRVSFKKTFDKQLKILEQKGLIEITDKSCRLSENGLLFADGIAAFFIN